MPWASPSSDSRMDQMQTEPVGLVDGIILMTCNFLSQCQPSFCNGTYNKPPSMSLQPSDDFCIVQLGSWTHGHLTRGHHHPGFSSGAVRRKSYHQKHILGWISIWVTVVNTLRIKFRSERVTVQDHLSNSQAGLSQVEGKRHRKGPGHWDLGLSVGHVQSHAIFDTSTVSTTLMSLEAPCICPKDFVQPNLFSLHILATGPHQHRMGKGIAGQSFELVEIF